MIKDAVREASLLKKHDTAHQALFVSLKSQAEKYCSLIYCERKILYHD
jgi:hypothetical protein